MFCKPIIYRILIVDDDQVARDIVSKQLENYGFETVDAVSVPMGKEVLAKSHIDLALVGVNFSDRAGFDFVEWIRLTSDVPVISMTTGNAAADRIHGLETSGADYLVKPVDPDELLARVRAVQRRYNRPDPRFAKSQMVVDFSGWTIDFIRRELADPQSRIVDLTRAEFDVFAALVWTAATLSRDYLLEVVSSASTTTKLRTVDVLVSRLRRKLAGAPGPAPRILTVPGAGYRIEITVEG